MILRAISILVARIWNQSNALLLASLPLRVSVVSGTHGKTVRRYPSTLFQAFWHHLWFSLYRQKFAIFRLCHFLWRLAVLSSPNVAALTNDGCVRNNSHMRILQRGFFFFFSFRSFLLFKPQFSSNLGKRIGYIHESIKVDLESKPS